MGEEEVIQYMKRHDFLTLATCQGDEPSVATVSYVNDGLDIYFSTGEGTKKVQDIKVNPNVALLVSEPFPDLKKVDKARGMPKRTQLQYEGKAEVVKGSYELQYAMDILRAKFSLYEGMGLIDPRMPGSVVLKIIPKRLRYLDEKGQETVLEFS